jgi:hypothetical protein
MKENGQREVDGGRLDTLMGVSLKLLSKKYPSEIQWHGVKILLVVIGYISIQYVMRMLSCLSLRRYSF